jgi:hypothetical protein
METVGTTQAAFLLGISSARVRILLAQGRIKKAKKVGRVWVIPLFKKMPKVTNCHKGPIGTWKKRTRHKPTLIHVNKPQIDRNRKQETQEPVITIRSGARTSRCHIAEIQGSCRVIYQPDRPLACGATVWIEVDPNIRVISHYFSRSPDRALGFAQSPRDSSDK